MLTRVQNHNEMSAFCLHILLFSLIQVYLYCAKSQQRTPQGALYRETLQ